MDDPNTIPEARPPEPAPESAKTSDLAPLGASFDANLSTADPEGENQPEVNPALNLELKMDSPPPPDRAAASCERKPAVPEATSDEWRRQTESHRRTFRQNLFLLLGLTLAAFTLTSWILIRIDSPFGIFSSGPQEIVRAQLFALDRGELRPAYDMFSARYRGQVSFEIWHELIVTHMEMFHAEVMRTEIEATAGPGVSLDLFLHGDDDRNYIAQFRLVRSGGRWWIDDVHWTVESEEREVTRT
jgi:hypothetical protein